MLSTTWSTSLSFETVGETSRGKIIVLTTKLSLNGPTNSRNAKKATHSNVDNYDSSLVSYLM